METRKTEKKVVPESAFVTGWSQVPPCYREDVMSRLMEAFGINSKVTFYARMRGEVEVRKSQIEGIEEVFHSHGITDIWGLEPYSKSNQ
jgi:hypothetical protein